MIVFTHEALDDATWVSPSYLITTAELKGSVRAPAHDEGTLSMIDAIYNQATQLVLNATILVQRLLLVTSQVPTAGAPGGKCSQRDLVTLDHQLHCRLG
jgi:hypothetical protein